MNRVEPRELDYWQPRVNGITILSKNHLRKILRNEYSTLSRKPDFVRLLNDAERHIDLIEEIQKRPQLNRGDITRLARRFNLSVNQVHKYLKYATHPRLYWFLKHCCSKTEALQRIQNIYSELNGIITFEDLRNRLKSYYPFSLLALTKSYGRRINLARKFFEVLHILRNGGCLNDTARSVNVPTQLVRSWFIEGRKPDFVKLANQIPKKQIRPGNKWLPMKLEIGSAFNPTEFISVPLHVYSWEQVPEVLAQIKSLENHFTKKWENQYGKTSKAESFAYVLGIIVSDSRKETRYTSSRLDLSLSTVYDWSKQVGEAFCYYLSKIGIKADEVDRLDPNNFRWQSQMVPFITWLKQTCLGLQKYQNTSKFPINMKWLFKSPQIIRLRVLQGITDGDGFASVKGQCLGIASSVNRIFLQRFLKSFNIHSFYGKTGKNVIIRRNDSIIRASNLPFFLHSFSRQERANRLAEMIRVRKTQRRKPIPEPVINRMIQLGKEGMSNGGIIEQIFIEFHLSLSRSRVDNLTKKLQANPTKH